MVSDRAMIAIMPFKEIVQEASEKLLKKSNTFYIRRKNFPGEVHEE
jgi:hypothetical protein